MSIFVCEGCGEYVDSDYDTDIVDVNGALYCSECSINLHLVEDEVDTESVENELALDSINNYLRRRYE